MKITKLQGGLGNQMFQYAVAKSRSVGEKTYLDFSFLKRNNVSTEHFTKRDFELGIFNISFKEFSQKERDICFGRSFKNKLLRKLFYGYTQVVKQTENELVQIPDSKNIYFDGYFQSEKYFIQNRELLLQEFSFPLLDERNSETARKINSSENSVSIHIRRGDYLKPEVLKYHGCLEDDYCVKAISCLKSKYMNLSFFVFSDDMEYAERLFQNLENVNFINDNSGKDSWKDMALMSECRHHIIANSSFSWWGAWLSCKSGTTIAPQNWFNKDFANYEIDDFVPKSWIKI